MSESAIVAASVSLSAGVSVSESEGEAECGCECVNQLRVSQRVNESVSQ